MRARCLPTIATIIAWTLGFLGHTMGTITFLAILCSDYWYLAVAYGTFMLYDRKISSRGGRRFEFARRFFFWRWFADYFAAKLIKTTDLDTKSNYIFGFHPHGVLSVSALINFATEATGFSELFPGITPHMMTLRILLAFPFFRDIVLAQGLVDVSRESIEYVCGDSKQCGNAGIIVVGGAAESLLARPGNCTLKLKNRKGFVRMAIKTGAHLVPVYSFGETDFFLQAANPEGSRLRRFQEFARKWLKFAPVLFYGRGIFTNVGLLPMRRKMVTVVGAPIPVTKNVNPTSFEVNQLHEVYVEKLKDLFDKYKRKYSDYPDAELQIE